MFKDGDEYTQYQENLAFQKELNILRNDFYYKMVDSKQTELVDFLYKPLDTMSGDAYTAREIDNNRTFYLIIDGMGKGLSASLTAMIMTAFINHLIDKMKIHDSFSLDILIKESIEYMQPILLEEEVVAVDYILMNSYYSNMEYAKFAMPVMLLQNEDKEIIRIKSNNPPINKYLSDYKTSTYDTSKISKFLFYSDGVVENHLANNQTYADFIEEDFASSYTREDLKNKLFERIEIQEDDITLIFINRINSIGTIISEKYFDSTLENVDLVGEWYEEKLREVTNKAEVIGRAGLALTELFMNAFEHGSLNINSLEKHQLLDDNTYFQTLLEQSATCEKKIHVKISKLTNGHSSYIMTQITDEGDGFDTQILSTIFRNFKAFNGRGVFVSRKNSFGIYYNRKGNSVLYLNKI